MGWLDHVLKENPYILGAIACVATFAFLHAPRSRAVRITNDLVFCVFLWIYVAIKFMHLWPSTPVQSEIAIGTALVCFLVGLMLSCSGSVTFNPASHEFVFEFSTWGIALHALFAGVVWTLLPLYDDMSGGIFLYEALSAWITGRLLGLWRRVARAERA